MRNQILLATLVLLISSTLQQCTIGCLKCNNQNQCLLCDITQNYQLMGTTCRLSTQTNCAVFSQSGNCMQCAPNFYMDVNSQNCIAVGTANMVSNCRNYNSAQACTTCSNNNFLVGGSCSPVNSTIPNCQSYSANGVCTACSPSFLLSNDYTTCVSLPSNANCLYYTYIGCRLCNSGFVSNMNNYFTNFNSPITLNAYLTNIIAPSTNWVGLSVCQAVTVTDCVVYSTFNVCARCRPGFYLSMGSCYLFPLNTIFGCATYSALDVCSSCQSNYYLTQNTCQPNIMIQNCANYSTSSSTTTCIGCGSGFFLQGNSCAVRMASKNILNCQEPNTIADICRSCAVGFQLTDDLLSCLPVVPNCRSYSPSSLQTAALQCSACNNNFYLSSTGSSVSCVPGTVASCLRYQVSQNVCIECVNGFYLSNLTCVPHVNIANCVNYHPSKSNYCSTCTNGFFSFAYTTVCVQTTVRANCATYKPDGNSCDKCLPNYYLVSGACNVIPSTFANCNVFSGTACTLCNSGYMINTLPIAGTCILPLDYINSSVNSACSVMKIFDSSIVPIWSNSPSSTQTRLDCTTCGEYMYGYNPLNPEAICVNQNQLVFYATFISISQCKRYGLNYASTQTVVCMECNSGWFLTGYHIYGVKSTPYVLSTNPNGLQCTSTCSFQSTSSSTVIPDDFFGFVNICLPTVAAQGVYAAATFVSESNSRGIYHFRGTCRRHARVSYRINDSTQTAALVTAAAADDAAALLRVGNADYMCILPAPSNSVASTTAPTNYLFVSDVGVAYTDQYPYEVVSLTQARNAEPVTAGTVGFDFSTGFSNTVDSNSNFPTVFNYKGILETFAVGTDVNVASLNSLTFCDLYLRYSEPGTKKGFAFAQVADVPNFTRITVGANTFVMTCLRCQFGYQLSYTASGTQAANAALPSCVSMQNCASSTTVYGGLTTFLNSVFSCHLCGQTSGSTTYPTVWIETEGANTLVGSGTMVGWKVNGVYTSVSAVDSTNHGFKCAPMPSTIVGNSALATITIPTCAAFGYISVIFGLAASNGGTTPTANPERAVCLACAANTYPTYGQTNTGATDMHPTNPILADANGKLPNWIVVACTVSKNCDTSVINLFNSCGRCDTSKENQAVPVYYGYMDMTLANCYPSTTQNCFILASGSSENGQNTCDVCKAGYILNDDKICEVFRAPNQSITNSNFNSAWFVRKIMGSSTTLTALPAVTDVLFIAQSRERVKMRISYLLSFGQLQYGVTSCQSGWVQFPVNLWAPRVCMWSSYIYNNTKFPSTTQYISDCVRYNVTQVNNRHVCGGCNVGFVPTIDGTSCVSSTPLPNCRFAQSGANTALCYECQDNFYNVNGQCTNVPIANCASYVNTKWSFVTPSVLQCSLCLNGFVLSADSLTCTSGNVNNCMTYKQGVSTQCSECAPGFTLMTLANSVYYCYPLPASLNCQKMQASSSTSGMNYDTVSCAVCNFNAVQVFGIRQWTTLGLVSQPQTTCMQFTVIANCKTYDQNNSRITENTFGCLECNTGYWYSANNQTCLLRLNNPSQCVSFSQTSDFCLSCGQGSFLSSDKTRCVPFPNGIFMCNQYSSSTTCTQCQPGFYLSSNSCVQSTTVPNCAVYVANFTCSVCTNGLFLFNSTSCVPAAAANCLTFTSNTACGSCNPGFGLQTTNGITSCVSNVLPNCVTSTAVAPFTCMVCVTGYFPNSNGVCTIVSKSIINCMAYDTSSTCTTCSQGSVLNVARTSCNSTFYYSLVDSNCQQSFLLATPVCTQCALGSFFSNGTCVQCTNNTYASGCLSCDPTNVNVCMVCRPNFYMNSVGVCVSINPTMPNNGTDPSPVPGSSSITKVIALLFALVTLNFGKL